MTDREPPAPGAAKNDLAIVDTLYDLTRAAQDSAAAFERGSGRRDREQQHAVREVYAAIDARCARVRQEAIEEALGAVAAEDELSGEPPRHFIETCEQLGWAEALRGTVRTTKRGIADRIRSLGSSPPTGVPHG